jgi:hypothetical protein
VALGLLLWNCGRELRADLANDSAAYLSVARNALHGRLAATSVIHFDAERAFGTLPAPLVTFPAGYGLLTGVLAGITGLPVERSALVVSIAATLVSLILLAVIAREIGLPAAATRLVLLAFALNWTTLEFGISAASEPAFACVILGFVLLLLRATAPDASSRRALVAACGAGLLLGASYWLRYAGLFFGVGLAVLSLTHLVAQRHREFRTTVVTGVVAAAIMAAGLLRNVLLAGNWRGGNTMPDSNPALSIAKRSAANIDDLLFASIPFRETLLWRAAFLALGVAVAWLCFRARRRAIDSPGIAAEGTWPPGTRELLVLSVVYAALIFYAAMTTMISYDTRMYFPIVGPMLLLAAAVVTRGLERVSPTPASSRIAIGIVATMCAIYGYLQLSYVATTPTNGQARQTAELLHRRGPGGQDAAEVITALLADGGSLIANDGQMVALTLGTPTVSLVERNFSETDWSAERIRQTAAQFGARALALRLPAPGDDTASLLPSAFLTALARGSTPPPPWLRPVFRDTSIVVFAVDAQRASRARPVSPVPAS